MIKQEQIDDRWRIVRKDGLYHIATGASAYVATFAKADDARLCIMAVNQFKRQRLASK